MSLKLDLQLERPGFELALTLDIPDRGITALFGPSGAGKTTVLRSIAGLERIRGARVQFNDSVWQQDRRFVPPHRRRIGYVFQEASLFSHLSTRDNLLYGLRRVPRPQRRVELEEAISFLGLSALLQHRPSQLSGGQRQRVAIARALLTSPQLLLMDEPLSSLDLASRDDVLPHLERLHDELSIPIVYVSHQLGEVMRIADHLALLDAGRLVAAGSLHELLTRPDLPLAHLDQAGTVFDGVIARHDAQFHLSYVEIAGGRLAISQRAAAPGQPVRVRIEARDVSVALKPPAQSSITNILAGQVLDISPDRDPAQRLLRIDVGGKALLARITHRAAEQLALAPGTRLYAQIKSVALMD
jgi:molybdate transport system ATP-binding protein